MKYSFIFRLFHNIIGYSVLLLVVCLFFLPALVLAALLPEKYRHTNYLLFWFLSMTYRGVAFATLLPVSIVGKEHITKQPTIFVANHESALDIPFFGMLVGTHPHVWYVLEYYAQVPVLGFFVRRMGLPVDQESSTRAARSLVRGIRLVEETRSHTMIFPEGGRWIDGKVHDFFSGFAMIARKTGQPVVPVLLKNLGKALPPRKYIVAYYPISIIIGKSFTYETTDTDEIFTQRVHQWFVNHS